MKTLFITLSLVFAAVAGTVYGANESESLVSEVRKVEAFSSIEVTSVATIYFTQADTYSLKIEGKKEYVKTTSTTVKDGCLVIGFKDNSQNNQRDKGVYIYLTAPDLKDVEFTGVGSFNCNTPLKLNDVKFCVEGVGKLNVKDLTCRELTVKLEGVGKANVHVDCDRLEAGMEGIGSVTLTGTAGTANISKGGIGSVNTRGLKIGE